MVSEGREQILREEQEQIRLAVWLKKMGIRFAASANGGKRNWLEGAKLKRMGVSAGFPDIFIPLSCGHYHGLFLEIKRSKGGKVSDAQIDWLTYLQGGGYRAEVAHGFEQAKALVLQYLSLGSFPKGAA